MTSNTINSSLSTPLWTSEEIAAYTNGTANGSFVAHGVSIDTRTLQKDDLFIALKGDNFDGHAYINKAFENGASGALVHDKSTHPNTVKVEDTFTALYDLAKGSRERVDNFSSIAVTGSVGKTGTKEMLAHVFREFGNTHATIGNLNNHWGLPITLTRMPRNTQYGIFEMGMNHAGEISPLSRLAQPDIGIITWVAAAHMEFFDSIEDIAKSKAEIFDGMHTGGIAILPYDNAQFPILVAEARTKGISTILSFGTNEKADAHIVSSSESAKGNTVKAIIMEEEVTFTLNQFGQHHAQNALAVLLAVKALDCDLQKAAQRLGSFAPVSGRGNTISLPYDNGTITLIDETYNASPESMTASLCVLGKVPHHGRRIAVLGDMLELGTQSHQLHADIAKTIEKLPIDIVLCCGQYMKSLADALPSHQVHHFPDSDVLSQTIDTLIHSNDLFMIKGSHGSHMEKIIEKLQRICS